MKHVKRHHAIALLLCALFLLPLPACAGRSPEVQHTAAPAPTAAPTATPAPTVQLAESVQKLILEDNRSLWAFQEPYDTPWFYTFTDLDHNGRLEVIAACTQGSGVYTYAHMWELLPDYRGIDNCYHKNVQVEGPDDWPEVVLESMPCWYDSAADRWYYVCENLARENVAHQYLSWYALCLKDGVAEWELLATKEGVWDQAGNLSVTCTNAQGAPISEQEYNTAPDRRFAGMTHSQLNLDWTRVDNDSAAAPSSAATPSPVYAATPAPTAVSAPVITKDPTSESLAVGEKVWFIAHARNADSLTWQFVSPDGAIFDLNQAMSIHPGLRLEVLPEDTIAVSNVPASANGWGMRARFDGPGGTAFTKTAFLYVTDYAKLYGGILENYRAAYQSGGYTNAGYMLQRGMSEMSAYFSGAGYALRDLDGNGVPELIIAGLRPVSSGVDNVLFSLYTLIDGVPVALAVSQARARYYLLSNGRLLLEGSGGAYSSTYTVLHAQGDMTVEEGTIFTSPESDTIGNQGVVFYYQQGPSDGMPGSTSVRLSEEEFRTGVRSLEGSIYLPELTRIY